MEFIMKNKMDKVLNYSGKTSNLKDRRFEIWIKWQVIL